ncbi:hypothetical protein M0R45_026551 [Rubus argutus]|uniref:Uncharacterized protein n=1 Tax=Rubus argutus TaxID=59490 RepID=A0AAW1WZN6_RUBAR
MGLRGGAVAGCITKPDSEPPKGPEGPSPTISSVAQARLLSLINVPTCAAYTGYGFHGCSPSFTLVS